MEPLGLSLYLLFAVIHPVSELIGRTSLRTFLNKAYYQTDRNDFPVSRIAGIGGSLLVLAIFLLPVFFDLSGRGSLSVGFWFLAFGLALADTYQHAFHAIVRRWELAPWVHLITIFGVLVPLWIIVARRWEEGDYNYLWPLALGALIILLNWKCNSSLVKADKVRGA